MKPASSFFTLFLLGSLIANAAAQVQPQRNRPQGPRHPQGPGYQQPLPGQSQIISERVMQTIRRQERVSIAELLRLSPGEAQFMQARSLSIVASSLRGQAQLDILSLGRPVGVPQLIRRQLSEVRVQLPLGTQLADLELVGSDDLLIETITAEVEEERFPGPGQEMQPQPGEVLKLDIRREIRMGGELSLSQIVREQLGLTLEGAQIERVVLLGAVSRGYSATVQVLLNGRLVGPMKPISQAMTTPIPIRSFEEVQSDLRLLVRGNVLIQQVNVVVGNVRPIVTQRPERVLVSREISAARPLELGHLMPHEQRLVSSITLEARTHRASQAQVELLSFSSQVLATAIVSQVPLRPRLQLLRPMSVRELRLQSFTPVIIDSLEIEFERFQVW
jgi:hypothetical protein